MNIVLIPCYNRPEFLKQTLVHIEQAHNHDKYYYIFALDYGFDPTITSEVIWNFSAPHTCIIADKRYDDRPNYNILSGLKFARILGKTLESEYVIIIEEDIQINSHFFCWHQDDQQDWADIVTSVKNHHHTYQPPEGNKPYWYNRYQGLGVSIDMKIVDLILDSINESYFENPQKFCDTHFPRILPLVYTDHDGLIDRICNKHNIRILYRRPYEASHIGYFGLNRKGTEADLDIAPDNNICPL